jgi:hypothetical protein
MKGGIYRADALNTRKKTAFRITGIKRYTRSPSLAYNMLFTGGYLVFKQRRKEWKK